MKSALTLAFTFICFMAQGHEGEQAFYQLKVENGVLILITKMELPDVKKSLALETFCVEDQDVNWCAGKWVSDNVSITINDRTRSTRLESSYTEDGHLVLNFSLGDCPENITSLIVSNNCFLKAFPLYENILQIDLGEEQKGFKMNKERTSISLNL